MDPPNLSHLTFAERECILAVLRRDQAIREAETERVAKLKSEIRAVRLKGAMRDTHNIEKECARCREQFGWLFNTGAVCIQCRRLVCKKCRQFIIRNKWLCVFCFTQMELEAQTGHWFYSKFPKSKRDKTNEVISAGTLVQTSLRLALAKSSSSTDPIGALRQSEGSDLADEELDRVGSPSSGLLSVHRNRDENLASIASSSMPSIAVTGTPVRPIDTNSIISGASRDKDSHNPVVQSYGSRKANSHTNLNLLSPYSASRESIVSCYSDAGGEHYGKITVTGEIQFVLAYNYKQSIFEIHIKQCKGLAPVDERKNLSDPYVKAYLLPDKTKSGKRKTRIKKHTLNPVFEEVLRFRVAKSELETRTLCLMVWHNDRFGRNDFLGEVTIPLNYYPFNDPMPKWHKLQDRHVNPVSMLTYKGDLNLCLKYVTNDYIGSSRRSDQTGELQVLVKQARNLTAVKANNFSDPFCKCYLLPERSHSSKQKSPTVRRNCNPTWNHTFVFENVSYDDLLERSLELTIWDHDRLVSNDFLGGVRLNLGTGKSRGTEVDWMDSNGEEVSLWQATLDRPNCWIEGNLLLRVSMNQRK